MGQFAGLFGWIIFWGVCFELLNFAMKFINKKYISKLPPEKKDWVNRYRTVMKFVIKYHKPVGIITIFTALIHLTLMGVFVRFRISGFVAIALMAGIVLLGIYGGYINKNYKGNWLKAHRLAACCLIIAIGTHLMIG